MVCAHFIWLGVPAFSIPLHATAEANPQDVRKKESACVRTSVCNIPFLLKKQKGGWEGTSTATRWVSKGLLALTVFLCENYAAAPPTTVWREWRATIEVRGMRIFPVLWYIARNYVAYLWFGGREKRTEKKWVVCSAWSGLYLSAVGKGRWRIQNASDSLRRW